jgi:hypothetical protein
MIDFTLAELLTGLDMSDVERFSDAIRRPKLVRTDDPLEADASFRERVGAVATTNDWQTANAYELDAIGAFHGLIRHGYRYEETTSAEKPE